MMHSFEGQMCLLNVSGLTSKCSVQPHMHNISSLTSPAALEAGPTKQQMLLTASGGHQQLPQGGSS